LPLPVSIIVAGKIGRPIGHPCSWPNGRTDKRVYRGRFSPTRQCSQKATSFQAVFDCHSAAVCVIGDEAQSVVEAHARDTVKWAVDRLKQDFFTKDPKEIPGHLALQGRRVLMKRMPPASSARNQRLRMAIIQSANKALVMNIGTGGGTLVHELVHPFYGS